MSYAIKFGGALASVLSLGSCGSVDGIRDGGDGPQTASSVASNTSSSVSDLPVKIGAPFTVAGTTYTPVDIANYDEVGFASYYGAEMEGRPTANGENFVPGAITAAHKTLPLPSYVEVTALDTGRTILVRINDRGPFSNDRLIDLSEGAARQLGIAAQGVTGVRVRKVSPPEQERAVLRDGMRAAERMGTPDSLLRVLREKLSKLPSPSGRRGIVGTVAAAPRTAPAVTSDGRFIREGAGSRPNTTTVSRVPTPKIEANGRYIVQIAAFSSRAKANALARQLGANVVASPDGRLFRVRFGPFANEAEASAGQTKAKARGYPQAKVYRD